MIRIIAIIFTTIITSLYIFSFEFTFLPGLNTKKILAVIGMVAFFIDLAQKRNAVLNKNILTISVLAAIVSTFAFVSVVYNDTNETAYVTYLMSMWVWLAAAYAVVTLMRAVHGKVSLEIICNYLIAVCVSQCFIAIAIDFIPAVKEVVNTYIGSMSGMGGASEFNNRARLYGIGAAVDVAGTRFAAIEVIIAYLCMKKQDITQKQQMTYLIAFWIIAVIGNMIARTTTIGVLIALFYWIVITVCSSNKFEAISNFWRAFGTVAIWMLPIVVCLYLYNTAMREYIRFGFEGFFSLWEKGTWEVHSNDMLVDMYRFPETTKTWMIGDGYFENPRTDPYYIGYQWKGFYMGTDVGYLRFLFFFGIWGLLAFCLFFVKVCISCAEIDSQNKVLFRLLLVLGFGIWFKVSTDLFVVFALFLWQPNQQNKDVSDVEV